MRVPTFRFILAASPLVSLSLIFRFGSLLSHVTRRKNITFSRLGLPAKSYCHVPSELFAPLSLSSVLYSIHPIGFMKITSFFLLGLFSTCLFTKVGTVGLLSKRRSFVRAKKLGGGLLGLWLSWLPSITKNGFQHTPFFFSYLTTLRRISSDESIFPLITMYK